MFKNAPTFSSYSIDDPAKAKDFYGQTLGLELSDNHGMLMLQLAGGGQVMMYPKEHHVPATFTVLNFRVDDIEKAVNDLINKGVRFEVYNNSDIKTDDRGIMVDENMNMKIAWFKDPAGNILSVIEGGR